MIITNDNIRTLKPHDEVCHISYEPNYDNIIDLKEFRRIQVMSHLILFLFIILKSYNNKIEIIADKQLRLPLNI